jgi:hypothetical protein
MFMRIKTTQVLPPVAAFAPMHTPGRGHIRDRGMLLKLLPSLSHPVPCRVSHAQAPGDEELSMLTPIAFSQSSLPT